MSCLNLKQKLKIIRLALYPAVTIWCCLLAIVVFNVIFGYFMYDIEYGSGPYNVLLALVTGVTTSFIVSIVVELSNNYKNNRLSCYELDEYYHTIINFELSKNVANKVRNNFEEYKIHDIVQLVWHNLPKMSSVLFSTFENKKAFLTDEEIKILSNIKSEYDDIKTAVCDVIKQPLLYNTLNHPDECFLSNNYPENILKDSSVWLRKYLATKESEEAIHSLTDVVMSDDFLLTQIMSDYNISIQSMCVCMREYDDCVGSIQKDTSSCDDMNFDFENITEEDYKIWLEGIDEDLSEEWKSFVSWYISNSCYRIAQHIEELEKCLYKRPYVGIFLELMTKSNNEKFPNY